MLGRLERLKESEKQPITITALMSRILRISALKGLFHSDMHACLLTISYLLLTSSLGIQNWSYFLTVFVLIIALGLYIVYMFLVNDFFDIPTDKIAGEKREIHDMPERLVIALILLLVILSFSTVILLTSQMVFLTIYVVTFLLATFYSAPPLRFKNRGILGIASATLVEKTLPILLIFSFFQHYRLDTLVFVSLFTVLQVEMITHHQFLDYEGDVKAGVKTYVVKIGEEKSLRMIRLLQVLVAPLALIFYAIAAKEFVYAVILYPFLAVGYLLGRRLKNSGLLVRDSKSFGSSRFFVEDRITPFHYSFLTVSLLSLFPLFLGLILTLLYPLYIPLFMFSVFSQLYVIRIHYLPIARGAFVLFRKLPHK